MAATPARADPTNTTVVAVNAPLPEPLHEAGDTTDALPGVVRVPVAGPESRLGVGFAATKGYGWTESVLGHGDSHDRASGSLAASVRPVSFFSAALRLDGRYDWHTGPASTSGWVGDPRLEFRVGGALGPSLRLGAQVGVWFPGGSAPSWVFSSTTPDASVIGTFHRPESAFTLTSRAGFRWDNSAQSAPDANRLALPDRLALGLNQASAVLVGLGVVVNATKRVEVLADATWDLLVGDGAPSAVESPIVISAGARVSLDAAARWQLVAVASTSPSERPPVAAGAPLVDIEPRVSGFLTLVVRPSEPRAPEAPAAPPTEVAPVVVPVEAPVVRAVLRGKVIAEDGQAPVARAHLAIQTTGGVPREATTDDQGAFEVADLELGAASVDVTAEGFTAVTRTVTLSATAADLEVSLARALPGGQVRGLVRDFGGNPVVAQIHIDPAGVEVTVGHDGTFEANVAPGTYEVTIHATGYADQKRRVVVEKDGVTMLNVELRKGR